MRKIERASEDGEALLTRWTAELLELEKDLVAVRVEQMMFQELVDAIEERAGETPATWRNHYARLYLAGQSMAMRRIVRGKPGELSLGVLLNDLAIHSESITLELLQARAARRNYNPLLQETNAKHIQEEWCNGGPALDPSVPRRDRDKIFRDISTTLTWADETIAHIPTNRQPVPFTFGELEQAIKATTDLYIRYREFLTGTHVAIDLTGIELGWMSTFDRPLFPRPGQVWEEQS